MGHSSSGLGEKIQIQRVWGKGAWMLCSSHWFPEFRTSSGKPHLHFCPRPTSPRPGLGSEGKLISNTQIPPAASPMEGPENRGMREKILKINSWASPSPADWLSGALRVSFQFVVPTAAGQGVEGEGERDSSQLWMLGLWEAEAKHSLSLTPPGGWGGTFEKKSFFLEAVKSSLPVFPITSARGSRNCPAANRKVLPPLGERGQAPGRQWRTWPFHDALWPRPGPHPPRLMDASAITAEGLMAGAWARGRCPGRACTATVNNPLPRPGVHTGLQSPWRQRLSGATEPP